MITGTLYAWSASVLDMSKTFYELKLNQLQSTEPKNSHPHPIGRFWETHNDDPRNREKLVTCENQCTSSLIGFRIPTVRTGKVEKGCRWDSGKATSCVFALYYDLVSIKI